MNEDSCSRQIIIIRKLPQMRMTPNRRAKLNFTASDCLHQQNAEKLTTAAILYALQKIAAPLYFVNRKNAGVVGKLIFLQKTKGYSKCHCATAHFNSTDFVTIFIISAYSY